MATRNDQTTLPVSSETRSEFNKLKDQVNQKTPYRVTADLLLRRLIEVFSNTNEGMNV
jgi:hypothetical protein